MAKECIDQKYHPLTRYRTIREISKPSTAQCNLEHYTLFLLSYLPDEESLQKITRSEFVAIHDTHWGIESFHRAIKQVCGICRFMVRDSQAIKTHIFCSLQAFVRLEKMRSENIISHWYELQRNLFTLVLRDYIVENLTNNCVAYYT
ncbi:transposase [Anabaenopsis circularis NIES-21]|uniref:Transposase n=1 Tax=Anabaenopsis circularis NIES-21 TaxID=1085406 RepID=A0A1Z4GLX2_9CYAN|nr:transposase [Anabaenopsis circularis NIES-21]